ncbi:hypothetical protein SDJN02_08138, partial [Cucurbita argyrosperma subsp. argyrosperma]
MGPLNLYLEICNAAAAREVQSAAREDSNKIRTVKMFPYFTSHSVQPSPESKASESLTEDRKKYVRRNKWNNNKKETFAIRYRSTPAKTELVPLLSDETTVARKALGKFGIWRHGIPSPSATAPRMAAPKSTDSRSRVKAARNGLFRSTIKLSNNLFKISNTETSERLKRQKEKGKEEIEQSRLDTIIDLLESDQNPRDDRGMLHFFLMTLYIVNFVQSKNFLCNQKKSSSHPQASMFRESFSLYCDMCAWPRPREQVAANPRPFTSSPETFALEHANLTAAQTACQISVEDCWFEIESL